VSAEFPAIAQPAVPNAQFAARALVMALRVGMDASSGSEWGRSLAAGASHRARVSRFMIYLELDKYIGGSPKREERRADDERPFKGNKDSGKD